MADQPRIPVEQFTDLMEEFGTSVLAGVQVIREAATMESNLATARRQRDGLATEAGALQGAITDLTDQKRVLDAELAQARSDLAPARAEVAAAREAADRAVATVRANADAEIAAQHQRIFTEVSVVRDQLRVETESLVAARDAAQADLDRVQGELNDVVQRVLAKQAVGA